MPIVEIQRASFSQDTAMHTSQAAADKAAHREQAAADKAAHRERHNLLVRVPIEVHAFLLAQCWRNASSQNSEIIRSIRERMDRSARPQDPWSAA
jgi:hypothetical protein